MGPSSDEMGPSSDEVERDDEVGPSEDEFDSDAPLVPAKALACGEADDPPVAKRRRLSTKTNIPAWLDASLPAALVNPVDQQGDFAVADVEWDVLREPVVDENRRLPVNFDESHLDLFVRLPEEAVPQAPSAGKHNYTLKTVNMSTVEVKLKEKMFEIKALGSRDKILGQRNFRFRQYRSIRAAWEARLDAVFFPNGVVPQPRVELVERRAQARAE